jgi:hypothetical protein
MEVFSTSKLLLSSLAIATTPHHTTDGKRENALDSFKILKWD